MEEFGARARGYAPSFSRDVPPSRTIGPRWYGRKRNDEFFFSGPCDSFFSGIFLNLDALDFFKHPALRENLLRRSLIDPGSLKLSAVGFLLRVSSAGKLQFTRSSRQALIGAFPCSPSLFGESLPCRVMPPFFPPQTLIDSDNFYLSLPRTSSPQSWTHFLSAPSTVRSLG